ncbi:hypothetical protein Salat_0205900 [Sesamum alatum]|uniref:RNase H type-1 domain-containing protein n=1 Tax=Sesamum alatum TaxID=300844 RepID=A0AAE1YYM8_9LAMI|nr:hypothetical protein Salat_0205900 [Sesamum alatum]
MFVWRACINAIPTSENLKKRIGLMEGHCPRCEEPEEDLHHALLGCSFARQTWALSNIPWNVVNSWPGSYGDWMRDIMSKLQDEHIQWDSVGRSRAEQQQEQMVHWRPPPAEVSCGTTTGAKCAGAGVVARNSAGECLGWKASLFQGVADTEHVEALRARTTMELAVTKGWRRISIEGDCLNIIRRLNSSTTDNSMLGPIIHHTRELGRFCTEVEFSFIRRDGNKPAHLLARQAGNASRCWVELPNDIRAALLADSCQPE